MKKHLRAVHVETMNSLGMMLSQEDWDLVRFKRSETHHAEGENPDTIILEVRRCIH
jgi:succinate dehydrogenase flavin-adding protein (antitoxin of CptAB toxin-antitoxin module)